LTPQDRVGQGLAATGVQFGFGFGFLENQYPTTRFGTMPLPTFTGEPIYGRSSDDLGFCVTTQREDPEEIESVWTLYRFLVGPDYQRRYVVLRGLQPSLLALNQEEQFTENNPKWRGVALMTKPGNYHADGVWPAEVTPLMHQDAWERIVNQGEPVETVLADHKAKIDKILAEHDLPLLNGKEGWKAEWEQPEM
jgi:ABC-type glycerol-3-phosphate transport system substrate-binding protein